MGKMAQKKIKSLIKISKDQGSIFVLPSLIGVLLFFVIPYMDVFIRAFTSPISKKWNAFQNFKEIFCNTAFMLALKNTFIFMVISMPILIIISLVLAVTLKEMRMLGKRAASILLIPYAIPIASTVLLWKYLFLPQGFFNHIVGSNIDWLNSSYSIYILVLAFIWKNLGYTVILWSAGLASISDDIYDAAKVDGASKLKIFLFITIPNLYGIAFCITVLVFISTLKIFREAYLLAGDYPNKRIYMLQHLYNNWFRELSLNKMAAGAVLTSTMLFVVIIFFYKIWNEDES